MPTVDCCMLTNDNRQQLDDKHQTPDFIVLPLSPVTRHVFVEDMKIQLLEASTNRDTNARTAAMDDLILRLLATSYQT